MNIVSKQVRALFETAMTGFLALAALGMASIYVRDRVRVAANERRRDLARSS